MAAIQWTFYQALNPRMKSLSQQEKLTGVATLLYMQNTSSRMNRLVVMPNIRTTHIATTKKQYLTSVKDELVLRVPHMYYITCKCGRVYVGQMGRAIEMRCNEYMQHI
jgi:hypothetical protein